MGRLSYIDENVKLFWSPGKAGGLPRLVTCGSCRERLEIAPTFCVYE